MGKGPRYAIVDGFPLPVTFLPEFYQSAITYEPGEGDVIVATYLKCGTTWTQQIVSLILRKGEPLLTAAEYFSYLPFLELAGAEAVRAMPKPRCIKHHLPFHKLKFSDKAKYIYVARHPADCVVSFYHHTRFFPVYFFSDGSFDDFFDLFIKGETDFGDYFDNLLSWYEHRDEPNVYFTTYEAMKSDIRKTVLDIARFLGDEYHSMLLSNDEEVLKKVLEYSSMDFMRSTVDVFWRDNFTKIPSKELQEASVVMKNYAVVFEEATKCGHVSTGNFVRKGAVGDGKITLSPEQLKRLNDRIREKTAHTDVMNLWK